MECIKCGSGFFYTNDVGYQCGLYCSKCGTWQKWLNKNEKRLWEHKENNCKMVRIGNGVYSPKCNRDIVLNYLDSHWLYCPFCGKKLED